jgi:magnesium-transporting ATPase (P-type)
LDGNAGVSKIFDCFRLICNKQPSCCHDQEEAGSMTNRSTTDRLDKPPPTDWHTLPHAQVEQTLQSGTRGLSDAEARRRLSQYGPNRLAPPKRRGPLLRLLMQFHNILLYVMMGAAVITALLGHWVDTGVLMMAVVINAVIGFIQEGKAESALDAIRAMLSPRAMVSVTGSAARSMPPTWCRATVVLLASGDRVPADLRLIEVQGTAHRRSRADRRVPSGRKVRRNRGRRCAAGRPLRHGLLGHPGGLRTGQRHRRGHR